MVISDVQTVEQDEIADTLKILGIQSVMFLPMTRGSQIMGVLYVDLLDRPFGFAREDLSLFSDLSHCVTLGMEHVRLTHDSATIAAQ